MTFWFCTKNYLNNDVNQQLIWKLQIIQWLMELLIILRLTNSNIKLKKNREEALWIINTSKENIKNGFSLYYYKQDEIYKNINIEHISLSERVNFNILEDYWINIWIDNSSISSLNDIKIISINLIDEIDTNRKILENKNSILINLKWVIFFITLIIIIIYFILK